MLFVQQNQLLKSGSVLDTYKDSHDAFAEMVEEAGIKTNASQCFKKENFAVVRVFPAWACNFVERMRGNETCVKEDMFTKTYGKEVKHDSSRTLINCAEHLLLWLLISSFVTLALARHGFLMVVNSTKRRVAMVVTYIESVGEKECKPGVKSSTQAWHEDFCQALAGFFQHEFGLSVLVSCLGGSKVDIVRRSYGEEFTKRMKRHRFTVHLEQGEALIMGSGLRHRGCKYTERNVRLFLAFLVGKSEGAPFVATYNVQDFSKKRKNRGGKRKGVAKVGKRKKRKG